MSLQFAAALYFLLVAFNFLCRSEANAQEDAAISQISSHLAESFPEEEDFSELTEKLSFYRRHPLDLNLARSDQLKEFIFLSALQISNLYRHIRVNGRLKNVLELQGIEDFDPQTIQRILPFVTVAPESGYKRLLSNHSPLQDGNHELWWRFGQVLRKQRGFEELPGSHYVGSPQKYLLKYKYNLDDVISFSVTADKDAGESFFSGSSKLGFDFLSASLALYRNGPLKKIIIGDYGLKFGQGLSLWTGASFGKGTDVAGVAKKDTGLKPYSSADEFSFFRGFASTFSIFKNIDLSSFISFRNLDASLSQTTKGKVSLTTIGKSGLHRTSAEIKNKGSLQQLMYGTVLQFRKDNLEAGTIMYHSSYEHAFSRGNVRYRQYAFEGRELSNFSVYYSGNLKSIYFFGEISTSAPGGMAGLQGVMTSISKSVSAVALYRNFAKDHHTFYSQGLGAGSAAANESGWYLGIHFSPRKDWDLSVYADLFRFPYARFRIDSSSTGADLMGLLSYLPRKNIRLSLKLSHQLSEQNLTSGLPKNPLAPINKDNCRISANWQLSSRLKFGNRIEINKYRKGSTASSYGLMVYQDGDFNPVSSKLAANIRVAYFNTPIYENRIYAYEDDVLYGASSGMYYGRGFRSFLNLSFKFSSKLKAWGRYAIYYYPGKEKLGSGLDEIAGNIKPEIRLQLRYQF